MKNSIIIVAYKDYTSLNRCLQSLADHPTKDTSEIIIWDNSPEPIEGKVPNKLVMDILANYLNITFYSGDGNLGFAEGCNKAVEKSTGDTIFLVNPDTVVYDNWCNGLKYHLKQGVGAVGPISNFVAGFQGASVHMQPDSDLEKCARLAYKGNYQRGVETKLLIGFFMCIPRWVWNRSGGLDEQFFLGCDDLDFSLRLRYDNFSLVIASDVFVYHEGHTSFKESNESEALNKQAEKKLLAKLKEKYGDNIPSATELWGFEILPTYVPKKMTLSVCMIVKDESKGLEELLPKLSFADEVIIVDTGYLPDTMIDICKIKIEDSIKKEYGPLFCRMYRTLFGIFHNPWNDSFAEARNFALSKCTGDYILWLDADDRIPEETGKLIRAALDNPGPLTQAKKCHFGFNIRDAGVNGKKFFCQQPRMFPRIDGIKWEGRVHEKYAHLCEAMGLKYVMVPDIIIDHTGYSDPVLNKQKEERNIRLLNMEPDSIDKFYYVGKTYQSWGEYDKAIETLCKAIDFTEPWMKGAVDQLGYQIALCLYQKHKGPVFEMLNFLHDNDKPDARFLLAEYFYGKGEITLAKSIYKEYLSLGQIVDTRGTDCETFREACQTRINEIEALNG